MNVPSADELTVIHLLFPELGRRFHIDWDRMEFSPDSQEQIRNVTAALDSAYARGCSDGADDMANSYLDRVNDNAFLGNE